MELKLNTAIDIKLKKAFIELQDITSNIYIPEYILKDIITTYTKLFIKDKINGMQRKIILAIIITNTVKKHQFNVNFKKLLRVNNIKYKMYIKYRKILGMEEFIKEDIDEIIEQYCRVIKLPDIIKMKEIETRRNIPEKEISNKTVTAAAIIYLATSYYNAGLTQEIIKDKMGISTTCLRNNYKKYIKYLILEDVPKL
jgi:transcription initiation factor TFIIIB Brf1 subunit/transcription initiation factor TFIIB